jgi:Family of unknown function (DUF6152)
MRRRSSPPAFRRHDGAIGRYSHSIVPGGGIARGHGNDRPRHYIQAHASRARPQAPDDHGRILMPTSPLTPRRAFLATTFAASLAAISHPALAHHGWDWADAQQVEMKGIVQKVSMAPPHPSLQVKAGDGVVWQVDLSNPSQTERSGFTGNSAKADDIIVILGNKHKDKSKRVMKAVRVIVGGKTYDLYPERIGAKR